MEVVTSFFGLFSFNNNKLLLLFMFSTFHCSFAHSFCITFFKNKINSHIKDRIWKIWMDMCKMWIKQVIVESNYWNTCMYFILKQFVGFKICFCAQLFMILVMACNKHEHHLLETFLVHYMEIKLKNVE